MPVDRSNVIWAYRTFLGRQPENDGVVDLHCRAADFRTLCESFIGSNEFKILSGAAAKASGLVPPPILMPRLCINTSADPDELRRLWQRVRLAWEGLGERQPFHSVLTQDRFLPSGLSESETQFWETGEIEAQRIADYLADGHMKLAEATVLEFGCGVGRVTIPLAALSGRVVAYDISEPHLALGRARAAALGRTNIRMIAIGDALPDEFAACEVFYSRIVLQHNPPPVIGTVLQKLIRALKPGGIGIFQVPTYRVDYHFNLREFLQSPQPHDMEMHCFPQAELFSLVTQAGASLVEMREDDAPGHRDLFISNNFVIKKKTI
jgi:SAM-dependent methyltransferase